MKSQEVISMTGRFGPACLLFLIYVQSAVAATFVVTKLEDDNGSCTPGDCALREAVIAANNAPGADRIEIPGGTYILSILGPDPVSTGVPESGDLDIVDDLELVGDLSTPTVIVGNAEDRVVEVGFTTAMFFNIEFTGGQDIRDIGGCVRLFVSTATFVNSTITNCFCENGGGGMAVIDSSVTLINTTVSNNVSNRPGGGIYHFGTDLRIINSTISGNRAPSVEGGPSLAGGIFHFDGRLLISNSTIARNEALFGDAMFSSSAGKDIQNSIIEGKCTGLLPFSRGGNLAGPDIENHCLLGSNFPNDVVAQNLGLGPLVDNGGPTLTHALVPGSPAIDAADPDQCEATDQRGVSRPQGRGCDIGAFETTSTVLPVPVLSPAGLVGLGSLLLAAGLVLVRRRGKAL